MKRIDDLVTKLIVLFYMYEHIYKDKYLLALVGYRYRYRYIR